MMPLHRLLFVSGSNARPHKNPDELNLFNVKPSHVFPHCIGLLPNPNSPNIPDLNPCDFPFFGSLKGALRGKSFEHDVGMIQGLKK